MKFNFPAQRILDFDIENRPLSYLGNDFTTSDITAIAASFGPEQWPICWLLGPLGQVEVLEEFRSMYDHADIVTGHYIRKHDLPIINGAMLELKLAPLGPKLTIDTKLDLKPLSGVSKSQESLADMLGVELPKVHMTQAMWRDANRLTPDGIRDTRERVVGDVRQHQLLRIKLTERGLLNPPKMWNGGR
jgi:hypothetical protein